MSLFLAFLFGASLVNSTHLIVSVWHTEARNAAVVWTALGALQPIVICVGLILFQAHPL